MMLLTGSSGPVKVRDTCKEGLAWPVDLHVDDESRIDAMLWFSLVGQFVGLR